MAMPSSPPITMQQLYAEFLAPNGTPLTSFVRGGAYVPNVAQNSNVPTSPPISLTQFLGAQRLTPVSAGSSNVTGSTAAGQTNAVIGSGSITASGGASPYTYSTTYLSGTSFTINNANTNAPQFVRPGNPGGGSVSGTYRCTVTDSASQQTTTDFTVTDNRTAALSATSSNVNGNTFVGQTNAVIGTGNITVSGGNPPYSYITTYLSGTSFTINNASTSTPQFVRPGNPGIGTVNGTYRCTVTDSSSQQVTTDFTVTDNRTT